MENAFLRWWGCGAFEVIFGDVNIAFDPYLFNENLEGAEPITITSLSPMNTSITVTHRPCRSSVMGIVSRKSLSVPLHYPAQPIDKTYGDAAFERDLPITKYLPEEKVQVLYPKHLNDTQEDDRSFPRSIRGRSRRNSGGNHRKR